MGVDFGNCLRKSIFLRGGKRINVLDFVRRHFGIDVVCINEAES